jgi:hypothetical protein
MPKGRGFQEPCNRRGVLHHSVTDHQAGLRSNHKLHGPIMHGHKHTLAEDSGLWHWVQPLQTV